MGLWAEGGGTTDRFKMLDRRRQRPYDEPEEVRAAKSLKLFQSDPSIGTMALGLARDCQSDGETSQ